jgi:hypothetical protein
MRWYFSRPTSDSDTAFEQAVFAHFRQLNLENPNAELHRTGYTRHGVDYLFFAISILPAYEGCICCKLPNGIWSAGVAREVSWFLRHDRIVLELYNEIAPGGGWVFTLARLQELNLARVCTVDQTRALVHYYQQRRDGGRSSVEDRTVPTWPDLGQQSGVAMF